MREFQGETREVDVYPLFHRETSSPGRVPEPSCYVYRNLPAIGTNEWNPYDGNVMKIPKALDIERAIVLGLLATAGIILYVRANGPRAMPLPLPQAAAQVSLAPVHVSGPRVPAIRRIYGHSIVPGGIHSVEELKRVIVTDPLAARHYAGFDVTKAYITRLPHDELVFLSYRLNHKIYFTSVLRLIRGGEEVLTDGNNYILTRCGNEIVSSFHGPVDAAQEPMDLDIVVAEMPAAQQLEVASVLTPVPVPPAEPAVPPAPPSATPGPPPSDGGVAPPPVYFVPVGSSDPPTGGTPVQMAADDLDPPTEITLLICGLAAILAWRFLTR
jgi:hypothetical protein